MDISIDVVLNKSDFCGLGITEMKKSFGGEEYSTEPHTYAYKGEKCLNEFADRRYEKYIPKI